MILFLCYVCPPLAVFCMGRPFSAVMNCFFTAFFWVPGVGHALVCYADYKGTHSVRQLTKAINQPQYTRARNDQSEGRVSRKGQQKEIVVIYDNPHVGKNGTYFRRK
jgi:uncharacterized membrane protein YqaE (UPF0057 family)